MRKWLLKLILGKGYILDQAVSDLFNTIGEEDILNTDNWTIDGKPIPEAQIKMIIEEAKYFTNSRLWKIIQADIKYQANLALYSKSKTPEDMIAGKLWLRTLDAIKTKLNKITT